MGGVPIGSASPQDAQLSPKDLPVVDIPSNNARWMANTVDLDRTMVAMAENALQYGASAGGFSQAGHPQIRRLRRQLRKVKHGNGFSDSPTRERHGASANACA